MKAARLFGRFKAVADLLVFINGIDNVN